MESEPLVSIVVPSYNSERYLRKTLHSLVSQTYEQIEVIVVDDGSDDGTGELVKQFSLEDRRVKLLSIERSGVSVARNKGIECSSGSFLSFLDSDDFLEPEFVKTLVGLILGNSADISFSGFRYVDESGNTIAEEMLKTKNKVVFGGEEFLDLVFRGKEWIWTGSGLYRADLIKDNDIRFVPGAVNGQDVEFIWKAILKSKRVVGTSKVLSNYLQRNNSLVRNREISKMHILGCKLRFLKFLEAGEVSSNLVQTFKDRILVPDYVRVLVMLATNKSLHEKLKLISRNSIYRNVLLSVDRSKSGTRLFLYSRLFAYLPSVAPGFVYFKNIFFAKLKPIKYLIMSRRDTQKKG